MPLDWRVCWFAVGVWKIVTEGIVRERGEWLIQLAPSIGILVGRLLVDGVPTLFTWIWLRNSLSCKESFRNASSAVLALAHGVALTSSHCPTSPRALPPGILAARKSVTGWITVGEYVMPGGEGVESGRGDMTFRYLRADHSLLGGLWVGPSRSELKAARRSGLGEVSEKEVVRKAESIYSTFILQELVRLVDRPADLPRQSPEQGLIIGLGAGLCARALAQHGVNLTLVEIDPVVYDFARDYFGVNDVKAGEIALADAVQWVGEQQGKGKLFDYIVHDVFTGGAVAASLFTAPFLSQLASLMHPSGILALNFAGTLSSLSSLAILTTVLSTFTSLGGSCRAFEDVPLTSSSAEHSTSPDSFINLVVLCSRSWYLSPLAVRDPKRSDYLAFPSPRVRHAVFRNFRAQEVSLERFDPRGRDEADVRRWVIGVEEDARRVEKDQLDEVRMHAEAMGKVLPPDVWASW
ncbi:hypothetical protein Rhopal_004191-T1 [Rhodotorula paludigena]|uniref:PABS domain-containing protein n=1 Tax=Rhodotorula paludigena TaxID=86838 RepID=A0AAV5GLT6_9BASI|nr:hypothetical protein Rhopal_004191-T1 [Rhodotorula paludigena]